MHLTKSITSLLFISLFSFGCRSPEQVRQERANPVSEPTEMKSFTGFTGFDIKNLLEGPQIPGLNEGFVPQGLGILDDGRFLISGYRYDGTPREKDGQQVGEVFVWIVPRNGTPHSIAMREDGEPFLSHGCGIAVIGETLFLAGGSDNTLYRGKWSASATEIELQAFKTYPFSVDALTRGPDGDLWAAQFYKKWSYGAPYWDLEDPNGVKKHALAARIDPATGKPRSAIALRQRVQGLAVTEGNLLLSTSWGQNSASQLTLYKRPSSWPATHSHDIEPWGATPVRHVVELAGDKAQQTSQLPSMSQGIAVDRDGVAWVLHESGASGRFPKVKEPVTQLIGYPLTDDAENSTFSQMLPD